jgi:peptidoglycan/LPS O-acetylase OafA/YrhL
MAVGRSGLIRELTMSSAVQRFPELDGLRGAAVLAVMAFHARVPFIPGGFLGVDVFFVLSGFLVTKVLVDAMHLPTSALMSHFYAKRAMRILPGLFALVFAFCMVNFGFRGAQGWRTGLVESAWTLTFSMNWARALLAFPAEFLAHTWSVAVEVQFYLLWPCAWLCAVRWRQSGKVVVCLALGLALAAALWRHHLWVNGASTFRLYNGLDTRLDGFMIGASLGALYGFQTGGSASAPRIVRWALPGASLVAAGLLLCLCLKADWHAAWLYQWGLSGIAMLAAIIIADGVWGRIGIVCWLLRQGWLRRIGIISYGLYLWHFPIYRCMTLLGLHDAYIGSVGTVLTFLVAWLSWRLLEAPLLNFCKPTLAPTF